MKTKLITGLFIVALTFATTTPSQASAPDTLSVAADALVARPLCFVATIVGSALFVVALPVAVTSKSTKKTAQALVVRPAQATFTRPLGDFDGMQE